MAHSPTPLWRWRSWLNACGLDDTAQKRRPTEERQARRCQPGGIAPGRAANRGLGAGSLLIEAAHSYRFPARIARHKLPAVGAVPEAVRAIAWKAQTRLCQRYRHLMAKGKPNQVVVTAIARELAGFIWSIACITADPPATDNAVTVSNGVGVSVDVATASEQGVRQVQHAPDTGRRPCRPHVPRHQPLKGARGTIRTSQWRIGRREPDGMIVHDRTD